MFRRFAVSKVTTEKVYETIRDFLRIEFIIIIIIIIIITAQIRVREINI